jgi:hypothetical protein
MESGYHILDGAWTRTRQIMQGGRQEGRHPMGRYFGEYFIGHRARSMSCPKVTIGTSRLL